MATVTNPTGPTTPEVLARAERYTQDFTPVPGGARIAVVACMDNRLDVTRLLGLANGEAYVIRNAGGVLTQDVRRSLTIAQNALGVTEIILIHHTDCGMCGLADQELADTLARRTGQRPSWRPGGFTDVEQDLREALAGLEADPFIPGGKNARGFVYHVEDGSLTEVTR